MEELIRWLFIIFIVVTFLRSIFKKKPAPGDKQTGTGPGNRPTGYSSPGQGTGYGSGNQGTGYGSSEKMGYGNPDQNTRYKTPDSSYDTSYGNSNSENPYDGNSYGNNTYENPEDDPRNYKFGKYVPPVDDKSVYRAPSTYSGNTGASSSDEYAIQKEIEALFKKDTQPSPPPNERKTEQPTRIQRNRSAAETTQDPYEKTQDPYEKTIKEAKIDTSVRESDHYIKTSKLDTSVRESDHEITPFKRTKKVSAEEEDRAKSFAESLRKKEEKLSIFNQDLRARLRHPETLKDYIIISEILGKPKAIE